MPPQQSALVAHGSPAGRQPGAAATQRFISHPPLQQSVAVMQAPPVGAQALPPQVPAGMSQATAQQAPARAHGCPSEAQAIALRHTSAPLPAGSSPQENEQQSEGRAQASPSARQAGVAQSPVIQAPAQQSRSDAQAAQFRADELAGSGGRAVNSTSRRQPSAQAIPTIRIVHRAGAEIIWSARLSATGALARQPVGGLRGAAAWEIGQVTLAERGGARVLARERG